MARDDRMHAAQNESNQRAETLRVHDAATMVESLPPDMAILKLENDSIQSMAVARPRNFELMKNELHDQLKAFPQLAEVAIYSKPVGKGDDGQQKIARGLSVRTAEILAEVYGYNRVRVDVTPIKDGRGDVTGAKVEATFTDYQRGRIWQDAGILPITYKTRQNTTGKHPEDRFFGVMVKGEASRRTREVILRSVNAGLKAWYWDEVEKAGKQLMTPEKIDSIIVAFSGKGVTLPMLERFIGRTRKQGWTDDDRLNLLGVWNSINDGDQTVKEAFRDCMDPVEEQNKSGEGSQERKGQGDSLAGELEGAFGTTDAEDNQDPQSVNDNLGPSDDDDEESPAANVVETTAVVKSAKTVEEKPAKAAKEKPAKAEKKPNGNGESPYKKAIGTINKCTTLAELEGVAASINYDALAEDDAKMVQAAVRNKKVELE